MRLLVSLILLGAVNTGWAIGNLACQDLSGVWVGKLSSPAALPVSVELEITEVTHITANAPIGGSLNINNTGSQSAIGRCMSNIQGLEFFVRETDHPYVTLSSGGMISPDQAYVTLVEENGAMYVGVINKIKN